MQYDSSVPSFQEIERDRVLTAWDHAMSLFRDSLDCDTVLGEELSFVAGLVANSVGLASPTYVATGSPMA